jgi:EmrB/QacA subfamily drug resistance transporter
MHPKNSTKKAAGLSHPALLAVLLCVFIAGIDHSIINVALPIVGRELNMMQNGLQWVVAGYTVAFAAGLFVAGRLSDRFGRKKMLLAGIVTFLLAAIYAAVADTSTELIVGRVLMGVGGTLLLPGTLAVISSQASERQKPHLIGLWSAIFGVGIALGPLLGGVLLNSFSWSSIFWINVPLLVLAAILVGVFLPETRSTHKPALRVFDGLLSAAAIGGIVMAIIEAPSWGLFDPRTLGYGLGGLALLALFVWRQRHIRDPLLDIQLFRNRPATIAVVTITMFMAAFAGTIFLIVQYAELVADFSALKTGAMFAPVAAGLMVGSIGSAHIQQKHSTKTAMATGATLVIAGLIAVALMISVTMSPWWISLLLAIATVGLGMATAASTATITSALPKHQAGMTSALNDLSREVGGSLGVAVLGSLAAWQYGRTVSDLLQNYVGTPLQSAIQGGLTQVKALPADALPVVAVSQATQSFVSGTRFALWISAGVVLMLLGVIIRYMPAITIKQKEGEAKRWLAH